MDPIVRLLQRSKEILMATEIYKALNAELSKNRNQGILKHGPKFFDAPPIKNWGICVPSP
jgi:hypothetical protein